MRHTIVAALAGLLALTLTANAAEAPRAGPSAAIALPPPKAEAPQVPADGSGYYRLNLDQALGSAPLTVVLELRRGKVERAAALTVQCARGHWCPADAAQLAYDAGRLHGTLVVAFPPSFQQENLRWKDGKPMPKYKPFDLAPVVQTAEIRLDARCQGACGEGAYAIAWRGGKESPFWPHGRRGEKGSVLFVREAPRPLPMTYECDLYLYAALANSPVMERSGDCKTIWLRLALQGEAATGASGFVAGGKELSFAKREVSLRDGRLSGRLEASIPGVEGSAFVLDLEGQAIGRRLLGTVACTAGDHRLKTQWIGLLYDVSAWRLPLGLPSGAWDWQHDLPADAELSAQAASESNQPVMPGEPGRSGFWTWRALVRGGGSSSIHSPCFDLREVEGAARYRFDLSNASGDRKVALRFDSAKPWHSLAAVWSDVPPGVSGKLAVTAVDGGGKDLPAAMRMGIIDKTTAKPATIDVKDLPFRKRPHFAGPYAAAPRPWNEVSLGIARWHRHAPGCPERRGSTISNSGNCWTTGGDHGYGTALADRIWAALAARALSGDPAERLLAEEILALNLEEVELHQRHVAPGYPEGYIYDYQADTPLAHWPGEAILDAWLQTGEPRWKEAAIRLGKALVACQNDRGAFWNPRSLKPGNRWHRAVGERWGPSGYFTWAAGYTEFPTAELLFFLGRIRRDVQTDQFAEAEAKAYQWAMDNHVRERNWPINVCHSFSSAYPIFQHGVAALYFSRYLLECAPPERRDLKLAEQVARWAEDYSIDWTRAPAGKQTGPITPRLLKVDRYNNEPIGTNMLAAVVFERLGRATGDRLWQAKGEALAVAAVQATDPKTGLPNQGLLPAPPDTLPRQFDDASFRHNDFCNGWAAQLLREYAALKEPKK